MDTNDYINMFRTPHCKFCLGLGLIPQSQPDFYYNKNVYIQQSKIITCNCANGRFILDYYHWRSVYIDSYFYDTDNKVIKVCIGERTLTLSDVLGEHIKNKKIA
jgi:hypothetical protein